MSCHMTGSTDEPSSVLVLFASEWAANLRSPEVCRIIDNVLDDHAGHTSNWATCAFKASTSFASSAAFGDSVAIDIDERVEEWAGSMQYARRHLETDLKLLKLANRRASLLENRTADCIPLLMGRRCSYVWCTAEKLNGFDALTSSIFYSCVPSFSNLSHF
jgi:hypothetical protein